MVSGFQTPKFKLDGRKMTVELEGTDGMHTAEFKMPVLLDKGVFEHGQKYEQGDVVSFGGSMWIAQEDQTTGVPGTDTKAWRLSVKHGRPGKDGVTKEPLPNKVVKL